MKSIIENQLLKIDFLTIPYFWIAISLLLIIGILLTTGRRFESALRLERIGIPIALLVGIIALLIGPYGLVPVLPQGVTDIWESFPTPLLTLVFATLMLGRPIPSRDGLFVPVANQALLALLLGFGQYLVGGLVVLFILIPFMGVDPLMGCLIEVGFEGGHGAAAVMGRAFQEIGFSKGLDLGLAMATVGLLSSTFIGSALIVLGRFLGWIIPLEKNTLTEEVPSVAFSINKQLKSIVLNVGFIGIAVLIGVFLLFLLQSFGQLLGGAFYQVSNNFPVFPLALIGSLVTRYFLEKFEITSLVSELLQREIGILSTDLLITTAMGGLNLPLLANDWLPLLLLGSAGLFWNLIAMFIFAKIAFRDQWFEKSIIEFGNATGVAASGILLLRLADPEDKNKIMPIFSIKQLFLQPILSGGVITVIAPIAITSFGLQHWTELCGALTICFFMLAFVLQSRPMQN